MAGNAVSLKTDESSIRETLQQALKSLDNADSELVLDFSSVHRLDPGAIKALEDLTGKAEQKTVRLVLHGVNVDVYKVLKLVRLAPRISFTS